MVLPTKASTVLVIGGLSSWLLYKLYEKLSKSKGGLWPKNAFVSVNIMLDLDAPDFDDDYGAKVGVWRTLRMLENLPKTFLTFATTLEQLPEVSAVIKDAVECGTADVCCQGLRAGEPEDVDLMLERRRINDAKASIETRTGSPPTGWCWRKVPSRALHDVLIDHDIGYSSYDHDDDLPDWYNDRLLLMPCTLTTSCASDLALDLAALKTLVDEARNLGRSSMLTIVLDPYELGHPAKIQKLKEILNFAKSSQGLCRLMRRRDILAHWSANYPLQKVNPGDEDQPDAVLSPRRKASFTTKFERGLKLSNYQPPEETGKRTHIAESSLSPRTPGGGSFAKKFTRGMRLTAGQ